MAACFQLSLFSLVLLCSWSILLNAESVGNSRVNEDVKSIINNVYQSWDTNKKVTYEEGIWQNVRSNQRATGTTRLHSTNKGNTNGCDKGYVGPDCVPVCEHVNGDVNDDGLFTGKDTILDADTLLNCTEIMDVIIDAHVFEFTILITSRYGNNPRADLFDLNGKKIEPFQTITENIFEYEAIYLEVDAGLYKLKPYANSSRTCNTIITALSRIDVVAGFVPVSDSKTPDRVDYPQRNAGVQELSVFMAHGLGLRRPADFQTVTIFQMKNVISRTQKLMKRYGCAYEYYIQAFNCPNEGPAVYKMDGYDFLGNRMRRLGFFFCIEKPPPTPEQDKCKNGGKLIPNLDGTSYCYCEPLFTGEDCSAPLCLNEGQTVINDTGIYCSCPNGYFGIHCEHTVCGERKLSNSFDNQHSTLILIIRSSTYIGYAFEPIKAYIRVRAAELTFDDKYTSYGLVMLREGKILSTDSYDFYFDLIENISDDKFADLEGDNETLLSAVHYALRNLNIVGRSQIYVISDVAPNYEPELFDEIIEMSKYKQTTVNMLVGWSRNNDMNAYRIATQTGGLYFPYRSRRSESEIPRTFINQFKYTFYRSDLLYMYDLEKCDIQEFSFEISVDETADYIAVFAAVGLGTKPKIDLIGPNGVPYVFSDDSSLDGQDFWLIDGPQKGLWMIKLNGLNSEFCSFRVYAGQYSSDFRKRHSLFSKITESTLDSNRFATKFSELNSVSVHISDLVTKYPSKLLAELAITRIGSNDKTVLMSNGIWHDSCNHELIFQPFVCSEPKEKLQLALTVETANHTVVQRAETAICSKNEPVPLSGCYNEGIQLDTPDGKTCFCRPNWKGEHCQHRLCDHGFANFDSTCNCTHGSSGASCEFYSCGKNSTNEPFSLYSHKMIIVMEITKKAIPIVDAFVKNIEEIVHDLVNVDDRWIKEITLIAYNSSWSGIVSRNAPTDLSTFIEKIRSFFKLPITDDNCSVKMNKALHDALEIGENGDFITLYHASSIDNDFDNYVAAYFKLMDNYMTVNAYYAFVNINEPMYMCDNKRNDYELLENLCKSSGGIAMPIEQHSFLPIMLMMPSYFKAGVVIAKYIDNMQAEKQKIYFPVDSYASSMQIYLDGSEVDVEIFKPDGKKYEDAYVIYDNSNSTGWKVIEIIKPCDDGWEEISNRYCANFDVVKKTRNDAKRYCQEVGGVLINELNEEKSKYLKERSDTIPLTWIGLHKRSKEDKNYYWDMASSEAVLMLADESYSIWAEDEIPPPADKLCIARFLNRSDVSYGHWTHQYCSERLPFICHKTRLKFTDESNFLKGKFPAGNWRLEIISKANNERRTNDLHSSLYVEVRVQSDIQLVTSLTNKITNDQPNPFIIYDRGHFVTHISNANLKKERNHILQHVTVTYRRDDKIFYSADYNSRVHCNYEWASDICYFLYSDKNEFSHIHDGKDDNGQRFQRITRRFTSVDLHCEHGKQKMFKCYCESYWIGSRCNILDCQNGGYFDAATKQCICKKGFTGLICELVTCDPKVPQVFSSDEKMIAFIVELTEPMKKEVNSIANSIKDILNNVLVDNPKWFKKFVLIAVDSKIVLGKFVLQTVDELANKLTELAGKINDPGEECGAPIFAGIIAALQEEDFQKPLIWVITRSTPNDFDKHTDFAKITAYKRAQIFYLAMYNKIPSICDHLPDDPLVQKISFPISFEGGFIFYIPKMSAVKFMKIYLPTVRDSSLIDMPMTSMDCTKRNTEFYLDPKMTKIYINVLSPKFTLKLTSGYDGQEMKIDDYYSSKVLSIKTFEYDEQSYYPFQLEVQSDSPCLVQVRGISKIQVWAGLVSSSLPDKGVHSDLVIEDLNANNNVFIVHATVDVFTLRIALIDFEDETYYRLFQRTNCSYEYFTEPVKCNKNFQMRVYGSDDRYYDFGRFAGFYTC